MKERLDMYDGQLEMSFGRNDGGATRRQRRLNRARWWFERMRQVVERARDWQPAPTPHPEQIWFPGATRRAFTAAGQPDFAATNADERQICE